VYFIREDSRGVVWLGTNFGLNRYVPESGTFVRYNHNVKDRSSLPSDTLRCMLEDSKGRLWFGTAPGGLSLLDPETGKFTHYTKKDGLSDDNIVSILEDADGRLWLGTNYGLCVFNPETKDVNVLDVRDGLQGPEFSIGRFKNSRGEMYFGGVDGLNRIARAALRRNQHIPPVVITSLKVFDRELPVADEVADIREIRLSHRENFFSIEFSALDYTDPKSNRYAYRLEGFDKDWIVAGSRRYASYTSLPGGNYVFRVKASNNNDVWNQDGIKLNVYVSPSFWSTHAAFVLYLAGGLFIVAGVIGWSSREQRLRLSVAELAERRRIGAELREAKDRAEAADKAKSEFLANISHEIRTPMNAVLGYSSILAEKMADDPRRSLVQVIDRSGRSLLALLNDALDLSRIDAGKATHRIAPLRIGSLVSDLTEMFRLRVEEKGVSLVSRIDPGCRR
jgi:signal transduction histidine kinase